MGKMSSMATLSCYLPAYEMAFHIVTFLFLLFYALYNVLLICNEDMVGYYGMAEGWSFLERRRDDYDYEFEIWRQFMAKMFYFYLIHAAIMEFIRFLRLKFFTLASTIVGAVFVYIALGPYVLLMFLIQTVSFYALIATRHKALIWINVIVWLLVSQYLKNDTIMQILKLNEQQYYQVVVSLAWNILRCTSFSMDAIDRSQLALHFDILDLLGYNFYAPTLFGGPIVIYKHFREMLLGQKTTEETISDSLRRIGRLICQLGLSYFWYLFLMLSMHFFYVNNFQYRPMLLSILNPFALFGYGYLLGQFFQIKYVIYNGVGIALGNFDRIQMPQKPRCIARTHKYSKMWKHFDHGLYEFLFKYIYSYLCAKNSTFVRKFLAAAITFFFIYVWHGLFTFVAIWAALNFVCIVAENLLTALFKWSPYHNYLLTHVGPVNEARINALLGLHVMIPSMIANVFFFADVEVGQAFFTNIYLNGPLWYLQLTAVGYVIYNACEWVERVLTGEVLDKVVPEKVKVKRKWKRMWWKQK